MRSLYFRRWRLPRPFLPLCVLAFPPFNGQDWIIAILRGRGRPPAAHRARAAPREPGVGAPGVEDVEAGQRPHLRAQVGTDSSRELADTVFGCCKYFYSVL